MVGEKISELRKSRGMTQEALASVIGVSAQSVSKWETGVSMPDIMLLPIIADIFDVSVDYLFGRSENAEQASLKFDDLPDESFDLLLQTMQRAWNFDRIPSVIETATKETKKYLEENPESQTAIYSEKGGAVCANHEIGLIFRKSDKALFDLLTDDVAAGMLSLLSNNIVRKIMLYQYSNPGVAFTASSVAAKLGISLPEVEKALALLVDYAFTTRNKASIDENIIQIYGAYAGHKMLLVYSVLRLAVWLANYKEHYRGFRGTPEWWC